jgi:triosephosphate isomerase
MQKGDDSVKVTTMEYADYAQKGYTFIRQDRQLIVEGYKSPIHDFAIYNLLTGEDLKEQVLQSKNYQIVFVMPFLSETDEGPIEELKKIYEWTKNRNIDLYALSSASLEPVKEFKKKHNLSFDIHAADQKMLMTMARYNPTFYLFKGSRVLEKYSGFSMPTISRLEEITGP